MSPNPSYSSTEPRPVGSVRVARRQLLTARHGHDLPPPRVVLHLPDLDALDGVVLGPPKPASGRRRIDAAHATPPPKQHNAQRHDGDDANEENKQPSLVTLLRGPLDKLAPTLGGGNTLDKLGKLMVLVQQPKMLLAAVVAVGLQLAAAWAMLTGGSSTTSHTASKPEAPAHQETTTTHAANTPSQGMLPDFGQTVGRDRPIQTPASVLPQASAGPTLAPSLPPAQSLPGLAAGDVPPWQTPAPAGGAGAGASSGAPQPSVVVTAPATNEVPQLTVEPADDLPAPAVEQVQKAASKPTRARLVGTIKKTSTSGTAQ